MIASALCPNQENTQLDCQLAIIGGGTGGFAAAWAALRQGLKARQ